MRSKSKQFSYKCARPKRSRSSAVKNLSKVVHAPSHAIMHLAQTAAVHLSLHFPTTLSLLTQPGCMNALGYARNYCLRKRLQPALCKLDKEVTPCLQADPMNVVERLP